MRDVIFFIQSYEESQDFWTQHGANYQDTDIWTPRVTFHVQPSQRDYQAGVRVRVLSLQGPNLLDRGEYEYVRDYFGSLRDVPILILHWPVSAFHELQQYSASVTPGQLATLWQYQGEDGPVKVICESIKQEGLGKAHRCVFGHPIRPFTIDPAWLAWNDGAARKIAHAIHHEGAFDLYPILGDALEDAGCDSADVLGHCRGEGSHVRGCWVIDLLLQEPASGH